MKPATLTALKASIAKWSRLARGLDKTAELGPSGCPLCQLFIKRQCRDCPVKIATGQQYCNGTPYEPLNECIIVDQRSRGFKALARREYRFLKSLLPPKDPSHESK